MLDLNLINGRYFTVKIGGLVLDLEPCKLKTLRKFTAIAKNATTDDDLVLIVQEVLQKNKNRIEVPIELVEELDLDQMNELLIEFFNWQAKEKSANPN